MMSREEAQRSRKCNRSVVQMSAGNANDEESYNLLKRKCLRQ